MYKHILIPLDNSSSDDIILRHIRPLAKMTGGDLILVHVADGYGARYQNQLNLEDSEEITQDRQYLEARKNELSNEGFKVKTLLTAGDPANEILSIAKKEKCDLIAMSTHAHRFFKDVILASVAE